MKLISFNINGIRAREHQLQALKADFDPDTVINRDYDGEILDFDLGNGQQIFYLDSSHLRIISIN